MTTTETRRPTLVTVVAVITTIAGVLSLLAGFVWLFGPGDESRSSAYLLIGIGWVVVGIGQLVVARGLLRGDPRARMLFVGMAIVSVLLTVAGSTTSGGSRPATFADGVLIVIALVILFTPKANAFFGRRAARSE